MKRSLTVIGTNFAVAAAAHVAARLLYLALLAIAARTLGLEGVGGLAVATAVATGVLFATDLGLAPRLVREASARRASEGGEYARALGIKLVTAPLVLAAAALVYVTAPAGGWVTRLCALMAVAAAIECFSVLNHAVCRSHERFDLEALGEIVQAVVLVALGGAALLAGLRPVYVGVAAIGAAAIELGVSHAFVRRFVTVTVEWPRGLRLVRRSLPYALTSLGLAALAQLDVLILALVASQAEVGRYAAVSRLLLGGAYLVGLAADVVLPRATAGYVAGAACFGAAARRWARLAPLAGGVLALVAVAIAKPAVTLVYGAGFAPVSPLLQLGAAFLFLKIAGAAPRTMLTAADRQPAHARSVAGGLAVTAAAIGLLGARHGATGAVVALILGETAGLAIALVAVRELWREATPPPS